MFLGVLIPTAAVFIVLSPASDITALLLKAHFLMVPFPLLLCYVWLLFRVSIASAVVFQLLGRLYQHSSIIINNANTSSIKIISNTASIARTFIPSLHCPHIIRFEDTCSGCTWREGCFVANDDVAPTRCCCCCWPSIIVVVNFICKCCWLLGSQLYVG